MAEVNIPSFSVFDYADLALGAPFWVGRSALDRHQVVEESLDSIGTLLGRDDPRNNLHATAKGLTLQGVRPALHALIGTPYEEYGSRISEESQRVLQGLCGSANNLLHLVSGRGEQKKIAEIIPDIDELAVLGVAWAGISKGVFKPNDYVLPATQEQRNNHTREQSMTTGYDLQGRLLDKQAAIRLGHPVACTEVVLSIAPGRLVPSAKRASLDVLRKMANGLTEDLVEPAVQLEREVARTRINQITHKLPQAAPPRLPGGPQLTAYPGRKRTSAHFR